MFEITAPNKLLYCVKWGINFFAKKHTNYPPHNGKWGEREIFMLETLHLTDWLWFLGCDTLITNNNIDAMQFCDYDLIIANDINGINNDSFFIKNCDASIEFLSKVLELNSNFPNDQCAMDSIISTIKTKIVSQRQFNSYLYHEYNGWASKWGETRITQCGGDWKKNDFVLHLPAMNLSKRIEIFKRVQNLPL